MRQFIKGGLLCCITCTIVFRRATCLNDLSSGLSLSTYPSLNQSQLRLTWLINLDSQLPKMLPIPHIPVRLLHLLQSKDLLIHDRLDAISVNRLVHLLKLLPRSHNHAAHRTDVGQAVHKARLVLAEAAQEADDGDESLGPDGFERLRHCCWAAHFDDMGAAGTVACQFLGRFAPVFVGLVVDHVICAVFFQYLGFGIGGCGGDDKSAGCFGKLYLDAWPR